MNLPFQKSEYGSYSRIIIGLVAVIAYIFISDLLFAGTRTIVEGNALSYWTNI